MAKKSTKTKDVSTVRVWAVLRLMIGFIMLWAFVDKMVGLGYATCLTTDAQTKEETVQVLCDKSVAKGGSATTGFLKFGTSGPLKGFYSGLAGNAFVDFIFMTGLLLIGLSLISGIGVKVASISGIAMMLMMYSAAFPGENNPLIDDHIVYAVVLFGIMQVNGSQVWGLGQWWQKQNIVKKYPILA